MFFRIPKMASLKELRIDPWPIIDMLAQNEFVVILRKNRPVFILVKVEDWNAMCDESDALRKEQQKTD